MLERAVRTRGDMLRDSFGALHSEIYCIWNTVHSARFKPRTVPTLSVTPQDLNVIIDHLIKDVPFQKAMVPPVLKDLYRAIFDTVDMVEE